MWIRHGVLLRPDSVHLRRAVAQLDELEARYRDPSG